MSSTTGLGSSVLGTIKSGTATLSSSTLPLELRLVLQGTPLSPLSQGLDHLCCCLLALWQSSKSSCLYHGTFRCTHQAVTCPQARA
eukprot:458284-Amphidinium_carterae.1